MGPNYYPIIAIINTTLGSFDTEAAPFSISLTASRPRLCHLVYIQEPTCTVRTPPHTNLRESRRNTETPSLQNLRCTTSSPRHRGAEHSKRTPALLSPWRTRNPTFNRCLLAMLLPIPIAPMSVLMALSASPPATMLDFPIVCARVMSRLAGTSKVYSRSHRRSESLSEDGEQQVLLSPTRQLRYSGRNEMGGGSFILGSSRDHRSGDQTGQWRAEPFR